MLSTPPVRQWTILFEEASYQHVPTSQRLDGRRELDHESATLRTKQRLHSAVCMPQMAAILSPWQCGAGGAVEIQLTVVAETRGRGED